MATALLHFHGRAARPGTVTVGARTFYEVLDIPPDASPSDVEAGYRRALDAFSDDAMGTYTLFTPEENARARQEIEAAYAVLRESASRAEYDAALGKGTDRAGVNHVFEARLHAHGTVASDTSVSDLSLSPARREATRPPEPEVPTAPESSERRAPALRIAEAVEPARTGSSADVAAPPQATPAPAPHVAVTPPEPEVLPPLAPPLADTAPSASAVTDAASPIPSSVPVSLSPTDPPPVQKFKRVRVDDDTVAIQVARPAGGSTTVPPPAQSTATEPPPGLPPDGEINGAVLQRLRESRGITLRDMSDRTKVSVHYLKAMEANAFHELPTRVYLRGFLIHYARVLGVSHDRLSAGYLAFADRFRGGTIR